MSRLHTLSNSSASDPLASHPPRPPANWLTVAESYGCGLAGVALFVVLLLVLLVVWCTSKPDPVEQFTVAVRNNDVVGMMHWIALYLHEGAIRHPDITVINKMLDDIPGYRTATHAERVKYVTDFLTQHADCWSASIGTVAKRLGDEPRYPKCTLLKIVEGLDNTSFHAFVRDEWQFINFKYQVTLAHFETLDLQAMRAERILYPGQVGPNVQKWLKRLAGPEYLAVELGNLANLTWTMQRNFTTAQLAQKDAEFYKWITGLALGLGVVWPLVLHVCSGYVLQWFRKLA